MKSIRLYYGYSVLVWLRPTKSAHSTAENSPGMPNAKKTCFARVNIYVSIQKHTKS